MKDGLKVLGAVVAGVALLVALWFGGWYLYRYQLNLQRVAVQQSLQYVEAKQSLLMQLVAEYHRTADPGTRRVLVNRMRLEAGRLRSELVPVDVMQIIGGYGR